MTFARPSEQQIQQRNADRKAANMRGLLAGSRAVTKGTYGSGGKSWAVPKKPSTRSNDFRDLAEGEDCCGCLGLHCDRSTTVLAHPNGIADNKGRGYKAHDHLGAFLGYHCHKKVDEQKDELLFLRARMRTVERLREIAGNPMLKPWKVKAAQWALDNLNATQPAGEPR